MTGCRQQPASSGSGLSGLRGSLGGKPEFGWKPGGGVVSTAVMRRLILPGTFLILLAAVFFLWQYRFERSAGVPTLCLADLTATPLPPGAEWLDSKIQPKLRLRMDPASRSPVVVRLDLTKLGEMDLLHVRFRASSVQLKPGKQTWDDGRCIIEWHSRSGGDVWENDPVGSSRFSEEGEITEWVMRPEQPPATAILRVEHLGLSGDFELSLFEATVVRERLAWKIGRWFLMAGWLVWAMALIRRLKDVGNLRALLAASIWVLMGLYFVVPGPWKSYRALGAPFHFGGENVPPAAIEVSPVGKSIAATSPPEALKSVGEIPDQGDISLRLKHVVPNARPLLHIALLFGPSLLIALLAGRKPALVLAVIFAFAIEGAQFAFGYGFDWVDVFDLLCDAVGIAIAMWLFGKLRRQKYPFPDVA
ncbi:MAG TPA: hypothetical protein VF258_11670 [Luteolibacter sp.]